jgi:hypothetical protein
MKIKFLILSTTLVLAAILSSCVSAPSPQTTAVARAKPFIVALKAYHAQTGDFPPQLDNLCPRYLARGFPWRGNPNDAAHYWLLSYERVNQDGYRLYLYTVPCSQAVFENGRLTWAGGPNYN